MLFLQREETQNKEAWGVVQILCIQEAGAYPYLQHAVPNSNIELEINLHQQQTSNDSTSSYYHTEPLSKPQQLHFYNKN